ncbi:MAG: tandem-95 repeat protein [Panacagrimonas sp.]
MNTTTCMRRFGLVVLALALAACGGGSGGSSSGGGTAPQPVQSVRGAVVKGPVQSAQVQLFALDDGGFATGPALQTLTTDASGRFEFSRPADGPALLAVTRGGSFVDEADPQTDPERKRRVSLSGEQGFESVLPAGATTLVVTPYTEALLLLARRAANGANFLTFFDAVRVRAVEAFGFDPFVVIPEAPLAPNPAAPLAARQYAVLLGGAALAMQTQASALGIFPTFPTIHAFIEDFSDGRVDGRLDGAQVPVLGNPQPLPSGVILADAVVRFRNNNFAAYNGLDATSIDEDRLSADLDLDNQPPLARDDLFSTAEDIALVVAAPGVLGNDIDSEDESLIAELVAAPANGTVALDANGGFTYTPNRDFNGTDSFTYRASDGVENSDPATVTITVGRRNDPPRAVGNRYSTREDTPLGVGAPGVLGNDSDPDGQTLSALLVSPPANGTLTLRRNGGFTYTPNPGFSGVDSFTYQASDGRAQSGVVTVRLTVNAATDPPLAADDSFSTDEDMLLTVGVPGVLGNDSDPDSTALTAALVSGPANGTLNLNPDGSFTYAPDANFSGSDSFTYRASDGAAQSAVATVSLTVNAANDVPLAADDAFSTAEETALEVAAPGVLANDADPDGPALGAILVTGPANGTLSLNSNGGFTYTPNANFSGTDTFTYQASDGTAQSGVTTVSLNVGAVNDAPQAVADNFSTGEDTPLDIPAPGVLGNDIDLDATVLTAILVAGPANGALSLNPNGGFRYVPNPGFNGVDSFTYRAADGAAQSDPATVSLAVGAVNDAPVAVNDGFSTNEDTPLNVPASGVLGNDSDPDNTVLTAVLVTGPANGILSLNPNGGFTYTPNANFSGSDSFTYGASDGTAQSNPAMVGLTVNAVNDAPQAVNDAFSTAEETVLDVPLPGVLANDSDADGSALTAILVAGPSSGTLSLNPNGSFRYTPNANFSGTDSFTYRASDGTAQSNPATVSLTVGPVNDPPVATGNTFSTSEDTALNIAAPGVLGNDSDPDGTALTAILVAGPANGTLILNPNGSFVYTPSTNFSGSNSFTYQASDGTAQSNVVTVNITVTPVNDAPVAGPNSFSTNEDTALNIAAPGVLAGDSDPDGNPLTAVLVAGPASGTLNLSPNGSFSYTPAANFSGSVSFTYRASDGTAQSNLATVNLTVNAVNDPPVAVNNSFSTNEDTVLNIAAPGVLAGDSDPDGNPLTAVLVAGPASGTLNLLANGGFSYTPVENFNGSVSFTYRASDGTAQSNVATVTLTVNAANDPPVALSNSFSTNEDTVLNVVAPGLLGNDTDAEDNPLTAVLIAAPAHGVLNLNPNGSFTYTPNANFSGMDPFIYRASDGTAQSANTVVVLTVNPVNDPPVANSNSFSTDEDTPLTVAAPGVLGNDSDTEGSALTAVLVSGPSQGGVVLNSNGSFTYTPNPNFNGSTSFTYRALDGTGGQSNIATVTLTVNSVNDAPVAVNDSYSTDEGVTLNVAAPGVLQNDTDPDNSITTQFVPGFGPTKGMLTFNSTGDFQYVPFGGSVGTDSFRYRATDGSLFSADATVTITLNAVNDPPVAVANNFSTFTGVSLVVPAPGLLANDTDPDGDPLAALLVTPLQPAGGSDRLGSLLFQDTFDGEPDPGPGGASPVASLINWTITAGTVGLHRPSDFAQLIGGGLLLDLDGTAPPDGAGTIQTKQSFNLPAGDYLLSFRASNNSEAPGNPINSMTVTVAGQSLGFTTEFGFIFSGPLQERYFPFTVAAPTSTPITFAHAGEDGAGIIIDDVRLIRLDVLPADGSFVYIPESCVPVGMFSSSFTYRATDGALQSAPATVTFAVESLGCD